MNRFNFVMDSFNRDGTMNGTMYCCNNDTVTIDTDFGENTTRIKDLKFCPSDDIEVKLTLTAMGNKTVKLNDGTTTKKTDFYAIVVNDQENVDRKVTSGDGG